MKPLFFASPIPAPSGTEARAKAYAKQDLSKAAMCRRRLNKSLVGNLNFSYKKSINV